MVDAKKSGGASRLVRIDPSPERTPVALRRDTPAISNDGAGSPPLHAPKAGHSCSCRNAAEPDVVDPSPGFGDRSDQSVPAFGPQCRFCAGRMNDALDDLKAWCGPGKVRTLETFIPAEHFIHLLDYVSIRERKRWHTRWKCQRNLRLQPEALPPWTEKNSVRLRERAAKVYRTKNAVLRKIPDWRLKLGERADRVSIPPSVAFRAITRSPRRPAARADVPHTPGRKKLAAKDEASFVKRKRGSGAQPRLRCIAADLP
jgi:hypothetical protein